MKFGHGSSVICNLEQVPSMFNLLQNAHHKFTFQEKKYLWKLVNVKNLGVLIRKTI